MHKSITELQKSLASNDNKFNQIELNRTKIANRISLLRIKEHLFRNEM